MHRRFTVLFFAGLLFAVIGVGAASAALGPTSGVHFTKNGTPTCTISGSGGSADVGCTSELAGLGEGDVTLSTSVSGAAVYQCENQGGNVAPGQNTVLVGPDVDTTTVPGGEIKNGRAELPTPINTISAPTTVTAEQAGCPNPNWEGVNPDLNVTSVTYSAEQGGVTVFSCTRTGDDLTGTIEFTEDECSGVAAF